MTPRTVPWLAVAMLNHVCWLCKANTGHEQVTDATVLGPEVESVAPRTQIACAAFKCSVCDGMSVALAVLTPESPYPNDYFKRARGDDLLWRPAATETRDYPDVPEHIAGAAKEAYECNSNQHYRAAIMVARAVIEATAKDKEIVNGQLYDKIEALADAGLIRALIKDAAHGVRELGNDMAHGDFVDPITASEADLVIHLMGEILNDVYQSPAKVEQARRAAEARKGARGG